MKGKGDFLSYVTVIGFFLILAVPVLNGVVQIIPEAEFEFNQEPFPKPAFNPENLDDYTEKYDRYFSENFSLRTNFITQLNSWEYKVFNNSTKPEFVIIGKEGWFYLTESREYYENSNALNSDELKRLKKELIRRNDFCKKRGIAYYTVVVPNKMNVFSEHLPRTIFKREGRSVYDQVVGLDTDSNINVIGLKQGLLAHKKDRHQIYQKTDDHWTDYGAFVGYKEMMSRLKLDFSELRPQSIDNYNVLIEKKKGNMVKLIGLADKFPEQYVKLVRKKKSLVKPGTKKGYKGNGDVHPFEVELVKVNKDGVPLKCLIIRDSFTLAMMQFINEDFENTVYIHDEWRGRIREDIIKKENPDIVLVITLETKLRKLLENISH